MRHLNINLPKCKDKSPLQIWHFVVFEDTVSIFNQWSKPHTVFFFFVMYFTLDSFLELFFYAWPYSQYITISRFYGSPRVLALKFKRYPWGAGGGNLGWIWSYFIVYIYEFLKDYIFFEKMIRKVTLNILIAAHGEPTPFIIRVEHIYLIGQALCCILSPI